MLCVAFLLADSSRTRRSPITRAVYKHISVSEHWWLAVYRVSDLHAQSHLLCGVYTAEKKDEYFCVCMAPHLCMYCHNHNMHWRTRQIWCTKMNNFPLGAQHLLLVCWALFFETTPRTIGGVVKRVFHHRAHVLHIAVAAGLEHNNRTCTLIKRVHKRTHTVMGWRLSWMNILYTTSRY